MVGGGENDGFILGETRNLTRTANTHPHRTQDSLLERWGQGGAAAHGHTAAVGRDERGCSAGDSWMGADLPYQSAEQSAVSRIRNSGTSSTYGETIRRAWPKITAALQTVACGGSRSWAELASDRPTRHVAWARNQLRDVMQGRLWFGLCLSLCGRSRRRGSAPP